MDIRTSRSLPIEPVTPAPYYVHPQDYIRRRRWTRPLPSVQRASR